MFLEKKQITARECTGDFKQYFSSIFSHTLRQTITQLFSLFSIEFTHYVCAVKLKKLFNVKNVTLHLFISIPCATSLYSRVRRPERVCIVSTDISRPPYEVLSILLLFENIIL